MTLMVLHNLVHALILNLFDHRLAKDIHIVNTMILINLIDWNLCSIEGLVFLHGFNLLGVSGYLHRAFLRGFHPDSKES
jgi:hypothetical protein